MKVYPLDQKYPTPKRNKIVRVVFAGACILLLTAATSCKTCKCPAYSEVVTQSVDLNSES